MLQPHAVPKDGVLAEQAVRSADRSSIRRSRCTADLGSSSVDAPWAWDAAQCPEYVAEVDVILGLAADFDSGFVIVAAVIVALLAVAVDPDLAVPMAAAVDAFPQAGSVASQFGAVRCGVVRMLHAVWHYVQSGYYGRFASFRDHHPEES